MLRLRQWRSARHAAVQHLNSILNFVSLGCWGICFWWMHRISSRQDELLKDLHDQTARIKELSQAEHDLLKDVHPKVGEIQQSVDVEQVAAAVNAET